MRIDSLTNIGFHVNNQDSQVDFFLWLDGNLYITSFDRFSTLMQAHIDRYIESKNFIGGGSSINGDLLLISESSLEVLECKTLYRKPLLGLLEKRKENEENMINSITDADLVNVDFQIKMLSSMFKDYCSNQANLSSFSQKTILLFHHKDLTEACNRICLSVLNGYHSDEEDWFKLDFQSVTPSLGVEKLLTEKRKKFAIMIACLSSSNMFYSLPFESRFQLSQYAEMLVCSLRLNEYCNDSEFTYVTKRILASAMERTLKKNQIDTSNHNLSSLFFSQVTLIFNFLVELFDEYKKEMMTQPQLHLDEFHSTLSYSINELFIRLFSSVLEHREKNKAVYLVNDSEISKSKDFVLNLSNISSLVNLLKELCQLSWSHLNLSEHEEIRDMSDEMDVINEVPTRNELIFGQLYNFYSIIFSQLREQCNHSTRDLSNLENEYDDFKKASIGKLLKAKQFGYALNLAEQNEEFETLVFICEETSYFVDGQQELTKYAQQYINKGFPEILFNWYLKQRKVKKLVDNLPILDTPREIFLKKHESKLLWLFYLRIGKYSECAKETTNVAKNTDSFFEKKYLLAVDSLCNSVRVNGDNNKLDKPIAIDEESYQNRHRELIKYQVRVADDTHRPEWKTQILSTIDLIEATLSISHPPHILDVASAFSIYNLSTKDHSYAENLSLLSSICQRTLFFDDWEYVASQSLTLDESSIVDRFWDNSYLVQILRSHPSLMSIITPKLLLRVINDCNFSVEATEVIQSAYAMVFSELNLAVMK